MCLLFWTCARSFVGDLSSRCRALARCFFAFDQKIELGGGRVLRGSLKPKVAQCATLTLRTLSGKSFEKESMVVLFFRMLRLFRKRE